MNNAITLTGVNQMKLKEKFKFELSESLKRITPIHEYLAIKREDTDLYEIWWTDEDEEEYDYNLYTEEFVTDHIENGHWIVI